MSNVLPEISNYDATVYQLQISDAVVGYNPANPNDAAHQGLSNQAALNLANRTNWLYTNLNLLIAGTTIPPTVAPINSAALTGAPTTPTPALGDNSLKIANTAFVQSTISGVLALSVAGGANVSLNAVQAGNGTLNFTGALTANIAVILPNTPGKWTVENNTTGAFTLTVKTAAGTGVAVTQGKIQSVFGDGTNVYVQQSDFPSVALTGAPTAPTAAVGDNSTLIATDAFVFFAINGLASVNVAGGANVALTQAQWGMGIITLTGALTANISVIFPSQDDRWIVSNQTTGAFTVTCKTAAGTGVGVTQGYATEIYGDGTNIYSARSDFGSVALTGVPTAPTATAGTNTTQIASTAFVTGAVAAVTAGYAPLASPALTGTPTAPTPAQFDSSTKIATTAFLQGALGNFNISSNTGTGIAAAGTALTNADIGGFHYFNGTVNQTATLPSEIGLPAGSAVFFQKSSSTSTLTISSNTGNAIVDTTNGLASSLVLNGGEFVVVVWSGAHWQCFGTYSQRIGVPFSNSIAANGYQKLPSGLLIQWGVTPASSASANVTVTFPIAFPNGCVALTVSDSGSAAYSYGPQGWEGAKTTFQILAKQGSTQVAGATAIYYAIGY